MALHSLHFLILLLLVPHLTCACFFSVAKSGSTWWFVDPQAQKFLSFGVNAPTYYGTYCPSTASYQYKDNLAAKGIDEQAWAQTAKERLVSWNFNTAGSWAAKSLRDLMPYTYMLQLTAQVYDEAIYADYFSVQFATAIDEYVAGVAAHLYDDQNLIGYVCDDEIPWRADWRYDESMLIRHLKECSLMPSSCAIVKEFLTTRYTTISALNTAWGTSYASFDAIGSAPPSTSTSSKLEAESAYLEIVARKYYGLCRDTIRKYDKHHLILGSGEIFTTWEESEQTKKILSIASEYFDVVSFNYFYYDLTSAELALLPVGKPFIILSYAFRAKDSGLPNTIGAGPLVDTQQQRGEASAALVSSALSDPRCVGIHVFMYTDQPAQGRADGENSNYGLVNIHDVVYDVYVNQLKAAHADALAAHGTASGFVAYCPASTCFLSCSGHGCCSNGVCECFSGYTGVGCQTDSTSLNGFGSGTFDTNIWSANDWDLGTEYPFTFLPGRVQTTGDITSITMSSAGCPTGCLGAAYGSGGVYSNGVFGYGTYTYTGQVPCASNMWLTFKIASSGSSPNWSGVRLSLMNGRHDVVVHHVDKQDAKYGVSNSATCEATHKYTVQWHEDSVSFLVDDVQVYSSTDSAVIPSTPGSVHVELWTDVATSPPLTVIEIASVTFTAEQNTVKCPLPPPDDDGAGAAACLLPSVFVLMAMLVL